MNIFPGVRNACNGIKNIFENSFLIKTPLPYLTKTPLPDLTIVRFKHTELHAVYPGASKLFRGKRPPSLRFPPVVYGEPGPPHSYRRRIFYPENLQYTTEPLDYQRLGGRDPVTGHKVVQGIGGGIKHKYRWVLFDRHAKPEMPVKERVEKIFNDPLRTANIALVASGENKRWIIASENMKEGQLITTHADIPRIPVRPKEGDAHPIGALPVGTQIHNVEVFPGKGGQMVRAAGCTGQILRKVEDRVIIQLPSKKEVSLDQRCTAVVGQVSNAAHSSTPIPGVKAWRWLGNRPRSGLWQRKDGFCGRKIRAPTPLKVYDKPPTYEKPIYKLSLD